MPASGAHDSRIVAYQEEEVVASASRTADDDSGTLTGYGRSKSLRIQLDASNDAGTTPTLDVVVEDTLDGTNWNTIASFTQVDDNGNREVKDVTTPFADRVRVRWTIGGTDSPAFTFSVIVASEVDPT